MLTVVLHDRSGNSQHKINNKVKDWKRLRGRSASFYLETWWNPRHHWLRGLSFPIFEMPRSKKGYVRWVTRDCGVPQSYSHSLSPVPFAESISAEVYWEIVCAKVGMFWPGSQSSEMVLFLRSFLGRRWGSRVPERSREVSCYCLSVPPPFSPSAL